MFIGLSYEEMLACGKKAGNKSKKVCVWLNKPNAYASIGTHENEYSEVRGMTNATTFDNIEQAEMFIKKCDIRNARIVDYKEHQVKMNKSIYDLDEEH